MIETKTSAKTEFWFNSCQTIVCVDLAVSALARAVFAVLPINCYLWAVLAVSSLIGHNWLLQTAVTLTRQSGPGSGPHRE